MNGSLSFKYVYAVKLVKKAAEDSKLTFNIMRQTSKNELMRTLQ